MKQKYFECECLSPEHRLVFILDEGCEDWPPELYAEVHLSSFRGFFGRIWAAIKYMFGYRCKYGHFDCFTLKPKDTLKFQLLLKHYKELHNNWVAKLKERSKKE